jgi:hypothetical protein
MFTGECHPPPRGRGVTSPVVRTWVTHRRRLLMLTSNRSAIASYEQGWQIQKPRCLTNAGEDDDVTVENSIRATSRIG